LMTNLRGVFRGDAAKLLGSDFGRELVDELVSTFGLSVAQAETQIRKFMGRAIEDPLQDLNFRAPDVMREVFRLLNKEALRTPETIESIDEQIETLTDQVAALKA